MVLDVADVWRLKRACIHVYHCTAAGGGCSSTAVATWASPLLLPLLLLSLDVVLWAGPALGHAGLDIDPRALCVEKMLLRSDQLALGRLVSRWNRTVSVDRHCLGSATV